MSSHNSPHFVSRMLGLSAISLVAVGCAGPQAYAPFQQQSTLSMEARWQALQSLAQDEQWTTVEADHAAYQLVAYRYETPGIRDRMQITLLPDRTVVETKSEIEDGGSWQTSKDRCANYKFTRERILVAHIENAASARPERKAPELVLPASRAARACGSGIR